MSREAMQMALEALEDAPYMSNKDDYGRLEKVTEALRKAINSEEDQMRLMSNTIRPKGKSTFGLDLLNQSQLAFRWGVSEATLERDRSMRKGCRYLKIGGLIRYRLSDIEAYENECLVETNAK